MQPEVPFTASIRLTGAPVGPMQEYEVCMTATTERGFRTFRTSTWIVPSWRRQRMMW